MRKKKYIISFSNKGSVTVDSYDQRDGGVYWVNGTIQGYSVNQFVKSIVEVEIFEDVKGTKKV